MRINPTYRQKVRLLQETTNSCAFCDFDDAGRIQFHHIDENPSNTTLENLIAVCPNCHSSIGEGLITMEKVLKKKRELEQNFKDMKKEKAFEINIENSTLNNPVVGNNNKITINVKKQTTKKTVNKYPDNSIGQDVLMYGYSKYLADQYAEFRNYDFLYSF